MNRLTPLERMFVEEFCRFEGLDSRGLDEVRIIERNRNPVGFMTEMDPESVPDILKWSAGVFNTPRVAVVGPGQSLCGSLLFFNKTTGLLDAIEGFVYEDNWPEPESPIFWSETEYKIGQQRRH